MRTPKIAIYEPVPRICGPDSWASYVRSGFRRLGCHCDVITFTSSGKPRARWGRIQREQGLSASCKLVPDRVETVELAADALDKYDLIVLTDVKCATQDKTAIRKDEPWPVYVDVLLQTSTPWTSALHGRLYFEEHEKDEHADLKRSRVERGSPFLSELLDLDNFAGALLDHCVDERFVTYSRRLREIERVHLPLPFELSRTDEEVSTKHRERGRRTPVTCVLGRVTQVKHRHLFNEICYRNEWPFTPGRLIYGGAASTTHGPSESFELYEQLVELDEHGQKIDADNPRPNHPWKGEREKGIRSSTVWKAWSDEAATTVEYHGMYDDPWEVTSLSDLHLGITDCTFSGGLCEFSTMEAIDGGCLPIISSPFEAGLGLAQIVIEREFTGIGSSGVTTARKRPEKYPELPAILEDIRTALVEAGATIGEHSIKHNRDVLSRRCDPTIHARAFLEIAGIPVPRS